MSNCCGEPLSTHHCPMELRHVEAKLLAAEKALAVETEESSKARADRNSAWAAMARARGELSAAQERIKILEKGASK